MDVVPALATALINVNACQPSGGPETPRREAGENHLIVPLPSP